MPLDWMHLVLFLQELGATIQQQRSGYVYATWSTSGPAGSGGLVDLEFLFAENDNTVRCVMQARQKHTLALA
jgi:hypothetical protein